MKFIPLTQGKVALVDDEDFELVSKFNWSATKARKTWYAKRYVNRDGLETTISLHVMLLPPKEGFITDHKNGNGLDCQKHNLRYATWQQNNRNRSSLTRTKTSQFRGVCWHIRQKVWLAGIRISGKQLHLGRFQIEEDAARAYDSAARLYFGEFCRPNFPVISPVLRGCSTDDLAPLDQKSDCLPEDS